MIEEEKKDVVKREMVVVAMEVWGVVWVGVNELVERF